jgi:AcrR family transcriptional regulator
MSRPTSASTSVPPARRGRPRTAGLDERVLVETRRSVEEHGYTATTVDHVAARAGVSKGSIYRRWPTKGVLVYDACIATTDLLPEVIDSGDIHNDLLAVARLTAEAHASGNDVFTHVLADAATDQALLQMLRERFFAPRSDAIVRRVELAVERGELAPGIDASLVPAVLNGAQQYVWGVRSRALDDDELARLVDMVIGAHRPV